MKSIYYFRAVVLGAGLSGLCFAHNISAQPEQASQTNQSASTTLSEVTKAKLLGEEALAAGLFQKAIEYFEFVLAYGDDINTTLFNIAVAHSKLEQYDVASQYLKDLIARGDHSPSTYYTLAVIEKNLGNIVDAYTLFKLVTTTDHAELAEAADMQMLVLAQDHDYLVYEDDSAVSYYVDDPRSKMRSGDDVVAVVQGDSNKPKSWDGFINVGYGYDDSVVDLTTEVASKGDNYNDFLFLLNKRSNNPDSYWYASAFIYATRYAKISEFDVTVYALNVGRSMATKTGDVDFSIGYDRTTLAGEDYMASLSFSARYVKQLQAKNAFGVAYKGKIGSSLDESFDYLESKSDRLQLFYRTASTRRNRLQFTYELQSQDHDDRVFPEGDNLYFNLSTQRHEFKIDWRAKLSRRWHFRAYAGYRISDYLNDFIIDDTGPQSREEDRLNVGTELSLQATSSLSFALRWHQGENESTIEAYEYERSDVAISMDWSF